jgi:Tfp pilus assembly protein PilO
MKLDSTCGRWAVCAAAAATVAAFMFFVYLPMRGETDELRKQLADQREYVMHADRLRATIDSTERDLIKIRKQNDAWRETAPDESELSALYGTIHRTARLTGTLITRFEPQPPVTMDVLRQTPVAMTSVGTYASIAQTLLGIERLPATLWVDELRLTPLREDAQRVQCEVKLVVLADNPEFSD